MTERTVEPLGLLPASPPEEPVEERAAKLLFVDRIFSILRAVYTTNFIEPKEHAVSAGIVADPSRGKSTMMGLLSQATSKVQYINEVTAYMMDRELVPKLQTGEITTVAISDLTNAVEKSNKSRKPFLSSLLSLAEEGVFWKKSFVTDIDTSKPVHAQIIFGVTKSMFRRYIDQWTALGLSSRFIWISWSYTPEQSKAVELDRIGLWQNRKRSPKRYKVLLPRKTVWVRIPENRLSEIRDLALIALGRTNYPVINDEDGSELFRVKVVEPIRICREFGALARAICYLRHLDDDLPLDHLEVNEDDLIELRKMLRYINLDSSFIIDTSTSELSTDGRTVFADTALKEDGTVKEV